MKPGDPALLFNTLAEGEVMPLVRVAGLLRDLVGLFLCFATEKTARSSFLPRGGHFSGITEALSLAGEGRGGGWERGTVRGGSAVLQFSSDETRVGWSLGGGKVGGDMRAGDEWCVFLGDVLVVREGVWGRVFPREKEEEEEEEVICLVGGGGAGGLLDLLGNLPTAPA